MELNNYNKKKKSIQNAQVKLINIFQLIKNLVY